MTREERREYNRQWRKLTHGMRKREGLCIQCGAPLDDVYIRCSKCHAAEVRSHNAEDKKRKMHRYKVKRDICVAFGVCSRCYKRDATPGSLLCLECRIYGAKYKAEKRQQAGIVPRSIRGEGKYCAFCGRPVEKEGDKQCSNCYEHSRKQALINGRMIKERRHAERLQGYEKKVL